MPLHLAKTMAEQTPDLRTIFLSHHRRLYKVAYHLTASRHDAEDIVQEVFVRLHAKLEREAMMVGQGRYFELWDSGVWSAKLGHALAGPAAPPPGMEDFSL